VYPPDAEIILTPFSKTTLPLTPDSVLFKVKSPVIYIVPLLIPGPSKVTFPFTQKHELLINSLPAPLSPTLKLQVVCPAAPASVVQGNL
jgi:hypothetical protein